MHICFLCDEYPPSSHGGIGTVTQTLARALVANGHAATVVGVNAGLTEAEPTDLDRGVPVVRIAHTTVRGAGFVANGTRLRSALARIHSQTRIDVLEGPESSLALLPRQFPAPTLIRM